MLKINRLAPAALSLALAAPFALPAMAQDTAAPTEAAPATPQVEQPQVLAVDDAKFDAFIAALRAVDELEREYTETLEAAGTDEEREAIVAEANAAMADAIAETPDITVEEYIAILQHAQSDPELAARIVERFQS
jgi:hypothetical protein